MLPFNFACKTFAYRGPAQGLSRSVSAFSSPMRISSDCVIKADQCAQNVDDIGIAAKSPEQMISNIRAVFKCVQNVELKLCTAKCLFGKVKFNFFGGANTSNGVTPQQQRITKIVFIGNHKVRHSKKALQRYVGFLSYYQNYITRLAERLNPVLQLRKTTENKDKYSITRKLMTKIHEINDVLDECRKLAIGQPLPDTNKYS